MPDRRVTSTKGRVVEETVIEQFKARLRGELMRPGDDGYHTARKVWNGMIDKYPGFIVRCAGVADVIDAITFARTHDLVVSVRGGGHNVAGKSVCNDGLMIDLSGMRSIQAQDALKFYYEYSHTAPDELSADAFFLTSPDGDQVFAMDVCCTGPLEEGERILQPLRKFGSPVSDQIGPIAYTELQASGDAFFPIGLHYSYKSHFMKEISDDAIGTLVSYFSTVPLPRSMVAFQQYGGAVSRVGQSETAFCHRDAQYHLIPTAVWTDPKESEMQLRWVRELWEVMQPFSTGGVYVNNLCEDSGDHIRAAYGPNYERLVALKNKYDPSNFFHLNANIKPTG